MRRSLTLFQIPGQHWVTSKGCILLKDNHSTVLAGATLRLCDGTVECVKFAVDGNGTSVDITATAGSTSDVCKGVQLDPVMQAIAGYTSGTAKTHQLGGAKVAR